MRYEIGKSFAWFFPWGRGYLAEFAYPGNKRTRFLRHPNGKPVVFNSFVEAIEAAQLQVRKVCEPDIVSTKVEADPVDKKLVADIVVFKGRREAERVQDRRVFRGLGKGFVPVEKRRRGA